MANRLAAGDLTMLRRAGLVHGLGRLGVSNSIWDKRGPLGAGEWERVRMQPYLTERMLHQSPPLAPLGVVAVQFRERLDGSGYPRGLKGEQIPLGARIFTIADSLDAMISDRPYRRALPMSHAREEIRRCSGSQFDPQVVDVFMSIPEQHWLELRENLGSPFRLAHLKNLQV